MRFSKLLALLYIFRDGGQGCLQVLGLCFFIIILILLIKVICDNFIILLNIGIISCIAIVVIRCFINYQKYKDETPAQMQERLEKEEKLKRIREWSKRNHC